MCCRWRGVTACWPPGKTHLRTGGKWNLAFEFRPAQDVTFNGAGMKFTIGSLTGDKWSVGFCKPGKLDDWRKGK